MAMKMCVVVPSRGRPESAERLAQAFKDTGAEADLYIVIDNDDPKWNEYAKSENYKKLPADNKDLVQRVYLFFYACNAPF